MRRTSTSSIGYGVALVAAAFGFGGCLTIQLPADGLDGGGIAAGGEAGSSTDSDGGGNGGEGGSDAPTADGTDANVEGDGAVLSTKLGDGHRGALTVDATKKVINAYAAVATAAAAGATMINVTNASGFVTGDLVLVVQSAGLSPGPASGDATTIDLEAGALGRWELARVSGLAGSQLLLSSGLTNPVSGSGAQVVTVPEYTDVNIPAGASLTAQAWDGRVGGVLAFFASGTVSNVGGIDVSATGFRGGVFKRGGTAPCTALDLAPPSGGQKGEGLVTSSFGDAIGGYGNIANGAGGGNCSQAGGGGGGNGGPGGKGGSTDGNDRGGRGGVSLTFDPVKRLSLGGGGGAGQGGAAGGTAGGRGGGIILIRAAAFGGSGFVRANGESSAQAWGDSSGNAGGGGGGAGGTIQLRVSGALACGSVEASGGNGGASNGPNNIGAGPGGGGGGGRVVMQAGTFSCPSVVLAGAAGVGQDGVSHNGAQPSAGSDPAYMGSAAIMNSAF